MANEYYGPDKYKGIRPTGRDKYYGPNKYKGKRQPKKAGTTSTKPAKSDSLLDQAKELGTSKYAPVLAEIKGTRASNSNLYKQSAAQRLTNLNREIGSVSAAGATTRNQIAEANALAQAAYQKAIEGNKQNTSALMDKVSANNNSMLSTLQAEMKARGASDADIARLSPVTQQLAQGNETLAALGKIREDSVAAAAGSAGNMTNRLSAMASMQENTAKSSARGQAQTDFNDLYNKWLAKKDELDTSAIKTELEKQDYTNNTYLTLKEKAAAVKAAKQQAQLQASIAAGNLNFKNTKLQVDTQYKYDKLASDVAQKDIENKLKKKGLSAAKAKTAAELALKKGKLDLDIDKFNWSKTQKSNSTAGLNAFTEWLKGQ